MLIRRLRPVLRSLLALVGGLALAAHVLAADAAPSLSWEDRDFDGLPDWADPYADDFANNTLWWEGEFLIDGERVTVSGWFADEGPDWNDDDGDWLPNFIDPYADDPTNNTAFWNGAAWIDGQWQEIAEPYPASSVALLDLTDTDEDTLPDVFDPYPEDASNNTAVWQGGEFVIDGLPRVLTGAGERYAADGGDVDADHIPDFADPYPEDAANDGREPVFEEPVAGASATGASVDGASVSSGTAAAGVSTPEVVAASSSGGIPAPSGTTSTTPPTVPPPALDDAAVLALLSTGSLPAQQTPGQGTAADETPPDPLSAATAAEVEQLVAEINELAQRPSTFNAEADAQTLGWITQMLVVESGGDPAAVLAAALAFRQTPQVTAQDSDGDGLDDLEETLTYLTDLTNPDTDGDGFFDGWEIDYSLDPLDAEDNTTADSDNDGLSNAEELSAGTHPLHADSDYGGVIDGIETRIARLRVLLGENTPQEYSAANPLDPQDDVPQENGPIGTVNGEHPEDPEDTDDDDTHSEQDEDMGVADNPPAGGGTPPGSGNEGTDDEEAEQDEQDMGDPGQPPPPEEPQETLREKWAREKREREAVLQERRDRLHEEHVAGVEQRAAAREQQREMNHHLSHPHGNHGVGVKNAGSRGLFDSAQRPLAFEPTAQYALSHGFDNVTRTWLNPRPANETPAERNTRLAQDWLERKELRDQQRVFWHPHGNHGNGVINPGARGLQTADNLNGALAFQASADYAQTEAYKQQSFENALFQLVRDSQLLRQVPQEQGREFSELSAAERQSALHTLQKQALRPGSGITPELLQGNPGFAARWAADQLDTILNGAPQTTLSDANHFANRPAFAGGLGAAAGFDGGDEGVGPDGATSLGLDPATGYLPVKWGDDSDGDGVGNAEEAALGTDAENPSSRPSAQQLAALERYRAALQAAAERAKAARSLLDAPAHPTWSQKRLYGLEDDATVGELLDKQALFDRAMRGDAGDYNFFLDMFGAMRDAEQAAGMLTAQAGESLQDYATRRGQEMMQSDNELERLEGAKLAMLGGMAGKALEKFVAPVVDQGSLAEGIGSYFVAGTADSFAAGYQEGGLDTALTKGARHALTSWNVETAYEGYVTGDWEKFFDGVAATAGATAGAVRTGQGVLRRSPAAKPAPAPSFEPPDVKPPPSFEDFIKLISEGEARVASVNTQYGGVAAYNMAPKTPPPVNPWTTATSGANSGGILNVPGRVQTRINLANGSTRFTPLKTNGLPAKAGWDHVVDRHFGGTNTQSQWSITQAETRALLQSPQVVQSPVVRVAPINGVPTYVREVDVKTIVGTIRQADGGGVTSRIYVQTDAAGNLITTYPIP